MDDFTLTILSACIVGMLFYIAATLTHIRIQLTSLNDKVARVLQDDDTEECDEEEYSEVDDDFLYIEDDGK